MDTLVELYDKEPLENVLAGCIFCPKRVVYLCDERDSSLRKERAVGRLFQSRGLHVETRFYYMNTADPAAIEHVLLAVARDYPGCVFDFTGGRDLVLLIAGLVFISMPGAAGLLTLAAVMRWRSSSICRSFA